MKDVYIVAEGVGLPAGTERATINLANMLVEAYRVTIVVADEAVPYYSLSEKVNVHSLGIGRLDGATRRHQWVKLFFIELRRFLRDKHAYALIGTNFVANCSLSILCLSLWFKPHRLLFCEHAPYLFYSPIRRLLRLFLYRGGGVVVALTPQDADAYKRKMLKAVCIPNSISQIRGCVDVKLSRPQGKILAVGRHSPEKGFDLLVKAFSLSRLPDEDWTLTIVGNGALREQLSTLIFELGLSGSVFLEPAVSDISKYFDRCTFFVLPSRQEAFSLVLLEAISAGVPAVATDCKYGPRSVLSLPDSNDIAGIIVPPDDVNALARAISRMAHDIEVQKAASSMGLFAARKFALPIIQKKWLDLLAGES